jgi:hypothetical protein
MNQGIDKANGRKGKKQGRKEIINKSVNKYVIAQIQ